MTLCSECHQVQRHTVRDSKADIIKIQQYLLEKVITKENTDRKTPVFIDPATSGIDTIMKGEWLQRQLQSKFEDLQSEQSRGELDLDYELSDT